MTTAHRAACIKMLRAARAVRTAKALSASSAAVRVPCSNASHDHAREHAWSSLRNSRPWPDAGLIIAECPFCDSTIAKEAA